MELKKLVFNNIIYIYIYIYIKESTRKILEVVVKGGCTVKQGECQEYINT